MPSFNKFNDPQAFAAAVFTTRPGTPQDFALVLGLDLGTNCGYSYAWIKRGEAYDPKKHFTAVGQLDLSAGPYDSGAIRFVRLRHFLGLMKPQLVFMEDVKYTPPDMGRQPTAVVVARVAGPCEFFGALKGVVSSWCEENGVPEQQIPIGVIKKRATGKGNANKMAVVAAANEWLGAELTQEDIDACQNSGLDNSMDAFWAMVCGLEQTWAGLTPAPQQRAVTPVTPPEFPVRPRRVVKPVMED